MVKAVAVVFMQGVSVKDRVEVNPVDAELLECVEFVDHALKVAAVASIEQRVLKVWTDCRLPRGALIPISIPIHDLPGVRDFLRLTQ